MIHSVGGNFDNYGEVDVCRYLDRVRIAPMGATKFDIIQKLIEFGIKLGPQGVATISTFLKKSSNFKLERIVKIMMEKKDYVFFPPDKSDVDHSRCLPENERKLKRIGNKFKAEAGT